MASPALHPPQLRAIQTMVVRCPEGYSHQCDRQWIAAQHHHQYQPPNRPLAVSVGAKKLGDVADGRILSLICRPLAQGGMFGFQVRKGLTLTLELCNKPLTTFAQSLDGGERGRGPAAL